MVHTTICGAFEVKTINISASYTASDEGIIIANATTGGVTITLPTASAASDRLYYIKKIDSSTNSVTIDGAGSETIDDGTTAVLSNQYEAVRLVSDGTEWWII